MSSKSDNSVGNVNTADSRQKGSPPLGPVRCFDYTSMLIHLFLNQTLLKLFYNVCLLGCFCIIVKILA